MLQTREAKLRYNTVLLHLLELGCSSPVWHLPGQEKGVQSEQIEPARIIPTLFSLLQDESLYPKSVT